jgi:hypothetical protein
MLITYFTGSIIQLFGLNIERWLIYILAPFQGGFMLCSLLRIVWLLEETFCTISTLACSSGLCHQNWKALLSFFKQNVFVKKIATYFTWDPMEISLEKWLGIGTLNQNIAIKCCLKDAFKSATELVTYSVR